VVLASPPRDTFAQGSMVFTYPMRGQSREQHDLDRVECSRFAVENTGFDPQFEAQWLARSKRELSTTIPDTPAPDANRGGALAGAAIGTVGGAVAGGIAGNAGRGAAIGAVGGTLFGASRRSSAQAERQQWDNHQAARKRQESQRLQSQFDTGLANYERAFSVCMRGRGYEVM
jgi:hypothetical protein